MVAIVKQEVPDLKECADPRGLKHHENFYRELIPAVERIKKVLAYGDGDYDAMLRSVDRHTVSAPQWQAVPKKLRDTGVGAYLAQELALYLAGHIAIRERVNSPSEKDPFAS